jgi:hypothetical protein
MRCSVAEQESLSIEDRKLYEVDEEDLDAEFRLK